MLKELFKTAKTSTLYLCSKDAKHSNLECICPSSEHVNLAKEFGTSHRLFLNTVGEIHSFARTSRLRLTKILRTY